MTVSNGITSSHLFLLVRAKNQKKEGMSIRVKTQESIARQASTTDAVFWRTTEHGSENGGGDTPVHPMSDPHQVRMQGLSARAYIPAH